jgi:hypothetical protein
VQPVPTSSSQPLNDVYAKLLDDLNSASFAAKTTDAKEQLGEAARIVAEAVAALDGADLSARNASYDAAKAKVASTNKQLETLQQQIDGIVSKVSTAKAIMSDVAEVVSVTAKLFPW